MKKPIYRLTQTAPPGAEPLTLDEMKTHLRVEHDADDALITSLIGAARELCEDYTGRALVTRAYSLYMDAWPEAPVDLPRPPLASVTRINVYAADDTAEEFDSENYLADTSGPAGRVVLRDGAFVPLPGRRVNGVEIQFKAGYGPSPLSVPPALRQGMKQVVAHLYERRGDDPARALGASGAAALFQPYRKVSL